MVCLLSIMVPCRRRYRDLLVNVSIAEEDPSKAHVAELQLHLGAIIRLKELAHANYGIVRGIAMDELVDDSDQEGDL